MMPRKLRSYDIDRIKSISLNDATQLRSCGADKYNTIYRKIRSFIAVAFNKLI